MKSKLKQIIAREQTNVQGQVCRAKAISHAAKDANGNLVCHIQFFNTNRTMVSTVSPSGTHFNRMSFDQPAMAEIEFLSRLAI